MEQPHPGPAPKSGSKNGPDLLAIVAVIDSMSCGGGVCAPERPFFQISAPLTFSVAAASRKHCPIPLIMSCAPLLPLALAKCDFCCPTQTNAPAYFQTSQAVYSSSPLLKSHHALANAIIMPQHRADHPFASRKVTDVSASFQIKLYRRCYISCRETGVHVNVLA